MVGVRVTILKDASRPRPRYIGQRLNGLSHGFGRLTFSDESYYEGAGRTERCPDLGSGSIPKTVFWIGIRDRSGPGNGTVSEKPGKLISFNLFTIPGP